MNVLPKGGHMPNAPRSRSDESTTCAFCRIIRGEEQAPLVFEDSLSLAFLDQRPLFPGHCLLVPKEHYETLTDLPGSLIGPLFQNAQPLERVIEEGLGADGTFIAVNNRVNQSIPHMHIHIVPRHRKDGLKGIFRPRQQSRMRQPSSRYRKCFARPEPDSGPTSSYCARPFPTSGPVAK
jgi:histidine triad (HIT) family protein